nr:hypothetical protein [Stenotrophomonas maltophilia]
MTTDLRASIASISAPTLVLGSWAGYQPMGATEESTRAVFRTQYAELQGVQIAMSAQGFHFLMWDDPRWLQGQGRPSSTITAEFQFASEWTCRTPPHRYASGCSTGWHGRFMALRESACARPISTMPEALAR